MLTGQSATASPRSSNVADRPTVIAWKEAWSKIADLRSSGEIDELVDGFEPSVADIIALDHPNTDLRARKKLIDERRPALLAASVVVVLPWRRCAIHLPDAETFHRIRMSHNRALMSHEEQNKQRLAIAAVAGLAIGHEIIENLVLGGGPRRLRIADTDRVNLTHLNRASHSVCDIGMRKTRITTRRVHEIDPFSDVATFDHPLDAAGVQDLLTPNGRSVDVFFEQIEYLPMKVIARRTARELQIPVVTVSDLGDSAVVDIERFDREPNRDVMQPETAAAEPLFQRTDIARLATATSLAGAAGAYVARRIIAGANMPSARYSISLESVFDRPASLHQSVELRAADDYAA